MLKEIKDAILAINPEFREMTLSDFQIGTIFVSGERRWRCTDIGSRVVVAILLDHEDDPSWYNGPPFAVVEHVFDEYGIEACRGESDAP